MDNTKSLYLKYRPTSLDEIVGQKPIVATLRKASEKKRFAHAYLFSGNHGCGKTSTARIVANLITCENVVDGKTCGECRSCQTVPKGGSVDVRELNGAKNGKVEHVNVLIDNAQYSPQELNKKVYIIDECHQLTHEAESNLLKIVEEPPSYLAFVFCTTEIKKIKGTILSRCQRFNFGKIMSSEMVARLQYIAQQENIDIEEEAVYSIARMARGSMRDAIGYLEQIATVADKKQIKAKHIESYFGAADRQAILNMIKAMREGNVALVLDQVNDLIVASADMPSIMFELADMLRNIQVLKVPSVNEKIVDLPDHEINDLKKIGESFKMIQLYKMAHLFSDVGRKMSLNLHDRWMMEATLISCSEAFMKQSK